MKNLNRKLSVIALSGMAVFGGVAASGVQAFAAGGAAVKQEVQKNGVAELQKQIDRAGFGGIYVVVKQGNRQKLLAEAQDIAKNSKFFVRGSMSVNHNNPKKSLERILGRKHAALVLRYKGENYLVVEDLVGGII